MDPKLYGLTVIYIILNVFQVTHAITCVCTNALAYSPVCGSDGKTYRNAKVVECINKCNGQNIRIISYQACSQTNSALVSGRCPCPERGAYSPVCGSDGRSYASAGTVQCYNRCYNRSITIALNGACPPNACICTNTRYSAPVCGNDGRTYKNPEIVRCLNKCQNQNIQIVSYRACSG